MDKYEKGKWSQIQRIYKRNQQFRDWVHIYCKENGCSIEEALSHKKVVRYAKKFVGVSNEQ